MPRATVHQTISWFLLSLSTLAALLILALTQDWPALWFGLVQPGDVIPGVVLFAWLAVIANALALFAISAASRPSASARLQTIQICTIASAAAFALAGVM